jgi:outer membrane protein
MKKSFFIFSSLMVIAILILSGSLAQAADKIGFVNMREVLVRSDAGKAMEEEFKKSVEEKRALIQKKENDLKRTKDNLEKQRSILTPQALQEKEMSYQIEFKEYERIVKDANEELQMKDQLLSRKIIPEVIKVIRAIAEKEKYALILEVSSVVYASKENSVTDKVIKELNRTYKGK